MKNEKNSDNFFHILQKGISSMANKKNKKMNDQKDLKENTFSKEGLENINKIQLQEFYGSFFGKNKEEVKKNSQKIRFKIYFYGLIIISVILVVTFLFNRVSFVTA